MSRKPIYDRPLIIEELVIIENELADAMRRLARLRKAFCQPMPSSIIRSTRTHGINAGSKYGR